MIGSVFVLLVFLGMIFLSIFAFKFSASRVYGESSWEKAVKQWLWVIAIQIGIAALLSIIGWVIYVSSTS